MDNIKSPSRPEKEEIRLQLLASMLANTNRTFAKQAHGGWNNFWRDLLRRDKIFH
ncbi:MAG: hypothetical protein ACWGOL_01595 [Desulfuromonadales bacterium]